MAELIVFMGITVPGGFVIALCSSVDIVKERMKFAPKKLCIACLPLMCNVDITIIS